MIFKLPHMMKTSQSFAKGVALSAAPLIKICAAFRPLD
jgi:hypothetical protein